MVSLGGRRALPDVGDRRRATSILVVGDDPDERDRLAAALERAGGFEARTTALGETARRLDRVDCVVVDARTAAADGPDPLAAIRERDPDLPAVLLVDELHPAAAESVRSREWTDYLTARAIAVDPGLLAGRIRRLVDHRRAAALARRALAAVEAAPDGIAIAAPDGTVAFAGRSFAERFDADPDALVGRPWRALFTPDQVDRFEETSLPAVEDGWRWSGDCAGRRGDGETFTARTTIVGLDDGSLVFALAADGATD